MLPVITISREFGSGGHSIAEKVAKELNLPFYDSNIVEQVAKESGYAKEFIEDKGEYSSSFSKWFSASTVAPNGFLTPQDEIFSIQTEILLKAMKEGPCVIVGRCADYICELNEISALNVFIHADLDSRKKRILERYGEQAGVTIEKCLEKKDKGRKSYYKFYTDRNWGDYKNYQLNLDSGYLGEQACVDIIVNAARSKIC